MLRNGWNNSNWKYFVKSKMSSIRDYLVTLSEDDLRGINRPGIVEVKKYISANYLAMISSNHDISEFLFT